MNPIELNLKEINRQEVFTFYKDFEDPFFNMTVQVDISDLYHFCKREKLSIFLAKLFVFTSAANQIPAFRYRIIDNKLFEFNKIHPGSTILTKDSKTFQFAYFEFEEDIYRFHSKCEIILEQSKQNPSFEPKEWRNDLIHFSSIPWLSFTSFKHARRFAFRESIPKVVFGKFINQNHQVKIPVSIEVHHAVMDAWHVSRFLNTVDEIISQLINS